MNGVDFQQKECYRADGTLHIRSYCSHVLLSDNSLAGSPPGYRVQSHWKKVKKSGVPAWRICMFICLYLFHLFVFFHIFELPFSSISLKTNLINKSTFIFYMNLSNSFFILITFFVYIIISLIFHVIFFRYHYLILIIA